MHLGYSITSFHPPEVSARDAALAVVGRASVAREAGYDYVQVGDHHGVAGGSYLQNVPMAARLAAEVEYVAALFLLPLYPPVLVAEQAGTLAALADRFDLWCAVGYAGGFEALGIPRSERAGRFEEALELLRRLWSEDEVTFEGTFYSVREVSVNPKADPRVVVGATAEPAVRRAGRLADAWVANANVPREDIADRIGWFRDAGGTGEVIARRDVLALSDGAAAQERAAELLANGYRGWPADADWVVAGDADGVAVELGRLADLGVDEVVVRPMDDAHADETLRTVAEARDRL